MGFTILQLCLANAMRDEKTDLRLANRIHGLREIIRRSGADIVSIKEIRECDNHDRSGRLTPADIIQFLIQDSPYRLAAMIPMRESDRGYHEFHLAQIYNPEKFGYAAHHMLDYKHIFEKPPSIGHRMLCVTYRHIQTGRIVVINSIHAPLDSDAKTRFFNYISQDSEVQDDDVKDIQLIKELGRTNILIGDFNLFRDDIDHALHLTYLNKIGVDVTQRMQNAHGAPMYGTFYPFPHDKIPNGIVITPPNERGLQHSKLDYCIVSRGSWFVWQCTTLIESRVLLFDHYPMLVQFD